MPEVPWAWVEEMFRKVTLSPPARFGQGTLGIWVGEPPPLPPAPGGGGRLCFAPLFLFQLLYQQVFAGIHGAEKFAGKIEKKADSMVAKRSILRRKVTLGERRSGRAALRFPIPGSG